MKLSSKSKNTLNRLRNKADQKGRMPSLSQIADLLIEMNIECTDGSTSRVKHPSLSQGCNHLPSYGTKTYYGSTLSIPEINLNMDTTLTHYSWNTSTYAMKLTWLIDSKLK